MDIVQLSNFLGWCCVLNISILLITTIALTLFKEPLMNVHSKLTGVKVIELPQLYFTYMANYKLGILLLNIVPYFSIKLML